MNKWTDSPEVALSISLNNDTCILLRLGKVGIAEFNFVHYKQQICLVCWYCIFLSVCCSRFLDGL